MDCGNVSNVLRPDNCIGRDYPRTANALGGGIRAITAEEAIEKEIEHKRYVEAQQKIDVACLIIDVAQSLIITHNVGVPEAFETARVFVQESKQYMDKELK